MDEVGSAELTAQLEMLAELLRERGPAATETSGRALESVREALEAERAPMAP
jgi:hypothetical protein